MRDFGNATLVCDERPFSGDGWTALQRDDELPPFDMTLEVEVPRRVKHVIYRVPRDAVLGYAAQKTRSAGPECMVLTQVALACCHVAFLPLDAVADGTGTDDIDIGGGGGSSIAVVAANYECCDGVCKSTKAVATIPVAAS
jgi:hypothetical protein